MLSRVRWERAGQARGVLRATWCGPCREEVPNVVAAYRKYHDRGFEVVGVSPDRDLGAMSQFASENGMVWPQHSTARAVATNWPSVFTSTPFRRCTCSIGRAGSFPGTRATTWTARFNSC
jgi:thiol-disulfide isomerase/thioredoxin